MKKVFTAIRNGVKDIFHKMVDDRLTAYAGSSTLFIIMSFLPFILLLITCLRFTPITEETLLMAADNITPEAFLNSVHSLIHQMYQSIDLTGYVLLIFVLLWTAGKGFHSLINGLNTIYNIAEKRNWFLVRVIAICYTIIFMLVIIICLALYVVGQMLRDYLLKNTQSLGLIVDAIMKYRWPIIILVLTLLFMAMYSFIPRKKQEFRLTLPGAVIASVGWAGFSYFFSLYVQFSTKSLTLIYGSLTTIICAMLWLYTCMTIFLFGAEFNVLLVKWFPKKDKECHRKHNKKLESSESELS